MGRRRTPTVLKLAHSMPSLRNQPNREAEAPPIPERPACPPHLRGYAVEAWDHYVDEMMGLGMLTSLDLDMLAAFCECARQHREACEIEAELAKQDPVTRGLVVRSAGGSAYLNPILAAKQGAARDMARIGQMLGLTPSGRATIAAERGGMASRSKAGGLAAKYGI